MRNVLESIVKNKILWIGTFIFFLAFGFGYIASSFDRMEDFSQRGSGDFQMKNRMQEKGNGERCSKEGTEGCSMRESGNACSKKGNDNRQGGEQGMGQEGQMMNSTEKECSSEECLSVDNLEYPVAELSQGAKEALIKAINDEYKAHATYEKTIEVLGMVRPFSMIIRAEEQHISSLKGLFDKYGIAIPEPISKDSVSAPTTLEGACQIGVTAEIENVKLYEEELLVAVKEYPDIYNVFVNLMNASKNRHLVAFENCAQ